MKLAPGILVFAVAVSAWSPAASQTIPKDTCSVLSKADLEAVLGTGATAEPIGDEQCRYEAGNAGYEIAVRRSNGATELKDWVPVYLGKSKRVE